MWRKENSLLTIIAALVAIALPAPGFATQPSGAKAIFDSGEGPSIGMSVGGAQPSAAARKKEASRKSTGSANRERYIGVSYKLVLLSDDGQFRVVPKSRVFRNGDRLKMLVRTNRPGYMTIMNVGPSGNTHVLFNDYVEAFTITEIPKGTNLRLVGNPGTERLLVMLSDNPNPLGGAPAVTAGASPPQSGDLPAGTTSPPSQADPSSSAPASSVAGLPAPPLETPTVLAPPPAPAIVSSIEGAKSIQRGAKDIVTEDSMQTTYSVVSPKNNWKPVKRGVKDIVLESDNGTNYGVIPASTISGSGGILTLEIKLSHR
jgi:hypothetical protein